MKYLITLTGRDIDQLIEALKLAQLFGKRSQFKTQQTYNLAAKLQKRDKPIEAVEAETEQMEIGG